jgi:hypothetical protein
LLPWCGRFALLSFLFALTLIAASANSTAAAVRITDDEGGNIGQYWSRFMDLRDSGQQVIVDGSCASACTMVLGIVPYDRICFTSRAVLGFHAAYRGFLGFKVINEPATRTLMTFYPFAVRRWIERHGGLGDQMIYLSGPALFAIYRKCS